MTENNILIKGINLKKYYQKTNSFFGFLNKKTQIVKALDGVSVNIRKGSSLGLVGESGSGKSTLGRVLLRLIEADGGSVYYEDTDITLLAPGALKKMRKNMQIIFQDPYSSLDPRMTIEESIAEPLYINGIQSDERIKRVAELIECTGLSKDVLKRYPHEFSGGQRQRIVIARALAMRPSFIVADEPVSALDVSIQAQILNLLRDLQSRFSLSLLFISHDLSVVRYICSRIAVMYKGNIVEEADSEAVCSNPLHPYTRLLISSLPGSLLKIDEDERELQKNIDNGCRFAAYCPDMTDICIKFAPELTQAAPEHFVKCHNYGVKNKDY